MKSVWKYVIGIDDAITIEAPRGAKVLHLAMQRGFPCAWMLVDDKEPVVTHRFVFRGTGHSFTGCEGEHVGTLLMRNDSLVFHLFKSTL